MPNWFIHDKWSSKLGIDPLISSIVNRYIDYGGHFGLCDDQKNHYYDADDPSKLKQLKYFFQKDKEKKFSKENVYVKSYFLHHLLDYFKETRHNTNDIEFIFIKFVEDKVPIEFSDENGKVFNFRKEVDEIFTLIRQNIQELQNDLKERY
ncbi:MAG: hypothetical protein EU539_12975 [Promethearchaeota archaeon]|nr:MAG: hypothetical protein EU539_12975 [Candidatus Lokiarchaeota archaeon]